ncbi:hypothetical protein HHK36_014872 [Tetracentron sinense]|uniref:Laccase n=1 Tax=Tetracentron sinense TaxID=13715 RepID=A0A834Z207_TETSI|nr:hypothetical protein HHK36_014872 [Tetracentron sinense]
MGSFDQLYESLMVPLLCAWVGILILVGASPSTSSPTTRRFEFNVEWKNVTRLCHTKPLITVNGEYPGPTIMVHEGANVEVKVTNRIAQNTTIHWHGIRQLRTGWADGPGYITQCPIGSGKSYVYKFTVISQRGTLLWHAHLSWQRASVYGEWWNSNVDEVEKESIIYGSGPNVSDAYTINALPGPLYPCSKKDTFIQTVEPGKTYLLRLINAALNDEHFFGVANHTLTVVEIDAIYTKPFTTKAIMVGPGQTTNVLLTADQHPDASGTFIMAATPYITTIFPSDNSSSVGFLRYKGRWNKKIALPANPYYLTAYNLPAMIETAFATQFLNKLRSLDSAQFPCNVPKEMDKRAVITISLNLQDCPKHQTCKGYQSKRFIASMNNQSFVRPSMSILECYYQNLTKGVYTSNFSERPQHPYNYTGTSILNVENHPIHVHGHNFFVVGSGFGNFDAKRDPANYNLVDPPERNTVDIQSGGWAAVRFKADNPGVWFVHCHLEVHTSWGLSMGFIVENGPHPSQTVLPPPEDLPSC